MAETKRSGTKPRENPCRSHQRGFNFLGFNIRRYHGKLLIKPQKEDVLEFCKNLGREIKKRATWKQENRHQMVKPNPPRQGKLL